MINLLVFYIVNFTSLKSRRLISLLVFYDVNLYFAILTYFYEYLSFFPLQCQWPRHFSEVLENLLEIPKPLSQSLGLTRKGDSKISCRECPKETSPYPVVMNPLQLPDKSVLNCIVLHSKTLSDDIKG